MTKSPGSVTFFTHPVLHRLIDSTPEFALLEGETLYEKGEPCASLPLLSSGVAGVFASDDGDRRALLYDLHAGEFCPVSIAALIQQQAYPATAIARAGVRLRHLPGEELSRLLTQSPGVFNLFLDCLTARLDEAVCQVRRMLVEPVDLQVATRLKVLLSGGSHAPAGATLEALAHDLGTTPQRAQQAVEKLAHAHCIRLQGSSIFLEDGELLEELLGTHPVQ